MTLIVEASNDMLSSQCFSFTINNQKGCTQERNCSRLKTGNRQPCPFKAVCSFPFIIWLHEKFKVIRLALSVCQKKAWISFGTKTEGGWMMLILIQANLWKSSVLVVLTLKTLTDTSQNTSKHWEENNHFHNYMVSSQLIPVTEEFLACK